MRWLLILQQLGVELELANETLKLCHLIVHFCKVLDGCCDSRSKFFRNVDTTLSLDRLHRMFICTATHANQKIRNGSSCWLVRAIVSTCACCVAYR